MGETAPAALGRPRLHLRRTGSTNERARELALRGAPHGTLVTAREQASGRGRQGRTWIGPPGRALLCSLVVREPPRLLPLAVGVAVAEVAGREARLKWPNDVLLGGGKVAGILIEGRPQEAWAVAGIGINVAVREGDLPAELWAQAASLGLTEDDLDSVLARLLTSLERWLPASEEEVMGEARARDALRGREIRWAEGEGRAEGLDDDGRLIVVTAAGTTSLDAGEVHLLR